MHDRGWRRPRTGKPFPTLARRASTPEQRARACKRLGLPQGRKRLVTMNRDCASRRSSFLPSRTGSTGSGRPLESREGMVSQTATNLAQW
jgi:hypothetical protein